jgi:taurine dioxygenase
MTFKRLTVLGAEVSGMDLSAPLTPAALAELRAGLAEHSLLVFRGQSLTGEQLLDLGRAFGKLFVQPVFRDIFNELLILENDEKRPPVLNTFHQDMTGLREPPAEHLLHALEMPEGGGDTIWSSNFAAWDSLSKPMQQFLAGLTATHSIEHAYGRSGALDRMRNGAELRARLRKEHPPVRHPVVRTHPHSGRKGLFVNRFFTEHIDGLTARESAALLEYLYGVIETPEFCCRLRWEVGTLAIWDNRCTSHYAVADYYPRRRRMQRASVCGEVPV